MSYTDADIEMREWEARGRDVANGVCVACEEALNSCAPKWDRYHADKGETMADRWATDAHYGGPSEYDPTMHARCFREVWGGRGVE